MKTISKSFIPAILFLLSGFFAFGQTQHDLPAIQQRKFLVSTQLVESNGTYEQRKLYREFLVEFMKNCPYISDFNICEKSASSDNHQVEWTYQVNGWRGITEFYNWVNDQLQSKNKGLKIALTPYGHDYAIGGKIMMEENPARKNDKRNMAIDRSAKHTDRT